MRIDLRISIALQQLAAGKKVLVAPAWIAVRKRRRWLMAGENPHGYPSVGAHAVLGTKTRGRAVERGAVRTTVQENMSVRAPTGDSNSKEEHSWHNPTQRTVFDPHEPPMPAKVKAKQALHFAESLARGTPQSMEIATTVAEDKARERA